MTWIIGLVTGAVMPNVLVAFLLIHSCNIAGVIGTYTLSAIFLKDTIHNATWLKPYMDKIEQQVSKYGTDSAILAMISLRIIPGSPNYTYNIILPHIETISLFHVLIGVTIGLAPLNFSWAQAGRMLSKIKSKSDIMSLATMLEFMLLAFAFTIPIMYKVYQSHSGQVHRQAKKYFVDDDEEGTQLLDMSEDHNNTTKDK